MALENDIRDMQAEILELRHTNDSLRTTVALQEQELDSLRTEVVNRRASEKSEIRRSEAMWTIINQVSGGLVAGIQRMDKLDKDTRRRQQEDNLGVGGDDASPLAVRRQVDPPVRRSMHLAGEPPEFTKGAREGDVIDDLDAPRSWTFQQGRGWWPLYGPAEGQGTTKPVPRDTPSQVDGRGQPSITRFAGPPMFKATNRVDDKHLNTATGEWWVMTMGGWKLDTSITAAPAITGTVRTDIADSRLPDVAFAPTDDERALLNMHDAIGRKQAR